MSVTSVAGPHKAADTFIDSSNAVKKANDANGVEQASKDRSAAAELNFDTFLKLLTVQLQYQDPMNPMEDTEWTTQLAQYSTLEAQLESNELLEKLAAAENLSQEALAISYIGKEALVKGSLTGSNGTAPVSINYKQNGVSANTSIEIREVVEKQDDNGNTVREVGDVVRTLEGTTFEGRNEIFWDSKDFNGDPVKQGYYVFNVTASDSAGETVKVEEFTYAQVTAVEKSVEGDMILSTADGRVTKLDDVLLVRKETVLADNKDNNGGDNADQESNS